MLCHRSYPDRGSATICLFYSRQGKKPLLENNCLNNIAIALSVTNLFFVEMEKDARRAEKELGINLTVKTGAQETSIESGK